MNRRFRSDRPFRGRRRGGQLIGVVWLFGLAFLFVLLIMLHYSLVISSHRDSIRRLAQSVALLERQIEEQRERGC